MWYDKSESQSMRWSSDAFANITIVEARSPSVTMEIGLCSRCFTNEISMNFLRKRRVYLEKTENTIISLGQPRNQFTDRFHEIFIFLDDMKFRKLYYSFASFENHLSFDIESEILQKRLFSKISQYEITESLFISTYINTGRDEEREQY